MNEYNGNYRGKGQTRGNHKGSDGARGNKKKNNNNRKEREREKDNNKNNNRKNINFDRINYKEEMEYEEEENNYKDKNEYNNNNPFYHKYNQNNNKYFYHKDNQYKKNDNKNKKSFLSFQKLKEMSEKDTNDIIKEYFLSHNDDIYEQIKNTKFRQETCYLMMKIIKKISEMDSEAALIIINKIFEYTNFFINTGDDDNIFYFINIENIDNFQSLNYNYFDFLNIVIEFLDKCLCIIPKSKNIFNFTDYKENIVNKIIPYLTEDQKEKINLIKEKITEYESKKKIINEENLKKKFAKLKEEQNKESKKELEINYQDVDAIINIKDFKKDIRYKICANKIEGKYKSYEEYINTMFCLEYEDCYRNLRRAIYELVKEAKPLNNLEKKERWTFERKKHDIFCYFDGKIIKTEMNKDGILLTIDFIPLVGKKIKFTKRMLNGSLVIITNNNYEDYLLVVVSYNPYVEKNLLEKSEDKKRKEKLDMFNIPKEPIYRIKFELINITLESLKFLMKNRTNLQLFESKAYFQSYIYILKRLKYIHMKEFPFKNEIIDSEFGNLKVDKESYKYKDGFIFPKKKDEYPKCLKKENLDTSQLESIKYCLMNKISLIQGPPGTGKSYVGSIITNILKENLTNEDSKILIVCFTNHALDQFLESILKNNENCIARIGGKCKNEVIKKYILNSNEKYKSKKYVNCEIKLNEIGHEMADIIDLLNKNKKVNFEKIKKDKDLKKIYKKIFNDFFKLLNIKKEDYINKFPLSEQIIKKYKGCDLNQIKEDKIGYLIFQFWINTGQKENNIANLISNIFEDMNIENYNEIEGASSNFKDYSIDDNDLINKLKTLNLNGNKNSNINDFPNNNNVDNNYAEEKEEEEEEDEDDDENNSYGEPDINDNEEKISRNDYDYLKNDELFDEIDLFKNISINFDGDISQIQNELELNNEQINYLLDEKNKINFFEIGHTIVDNIISYINKRDLDEEINEDTKKILIKYKDILEKKKQISMFVDLETLKEKKIIAMTTTGCAKYSTILDHLKFEYVIVEEAAEVLEPHILSLLTKNIKRLIMIGDHKQLKPKPYSYELCKKYNFNVSMFERLINNGIKYVSLKYQRRMKPLFADFVRLIYGEKEYIDKENEDEAYKENIRGMTSDMFIVTHKKPESNIEGMKSKCNEYEAYYLVKLCSYLLKQGYKSSQITFLTFYVGQAMKILEIIKDSLLEEEVKENLKVSTVDNYQGEENDIILLSLVRSNEENNIGFLRDFNRVCVAFSRAKLGFYVIGNIDCIIKGIEKLNKKKDDNNNQKIILEEKMIDVWEKIKDKAKNLKIIDEKLILKCGNREHRETEIKHLNDFGNCPDGGCNQKCNKWKKCGHLCEKFCHNFKCDDIKCLKLCNKININCPLKKHKCEKLCSEECGPCTEIIKTKLNCGHEIECECNKLNNIEELKCQRPCEKKLKCGHQCKLKCYENCENAKCKELIKIKLTCEHIVESKCYLPKYEILCDKKCNSILKCGHNCNGSCGKCLGGTLHEKCQKLCGKNLICGHRCNQKCSSECICDQQCPNECPHGECGEFCCDICIDCCEPCTIKCLHRKCQNNCGDKCDVKPCDERCKKIMKCNHQCMGLCGERCPNVCRQCNPNNECFEIFFGFEKDDDSLFYKTKCNHTFEYRGMDKYMKSKKSISNVVCPKCNIQLFWEPRYQNYIREHFRDVQKLKENYIKSNTLKKEFLLKRDEILKRIDNQYYENKILFFDNLIEEKNNNKINLIIENNSFNYEKKDLKSKLPIIYKLYNTILKNKDNKKLKYKQIFIYNLLTLSEKFMAIEYMNYIIKKKEKQGQDISKDEIIFMKNFYVIKDYFNDIENSFTYYFFRDLKIKIDNMLYYTILKLNPTIVNSNINCINEIIKSNFSKEDINLKNLYNNYYTNKALFLLGNLSFSWYKCNKGHIFCNEDKLNEDKIDIDKICPLCQKDGNKNHLNNKINIKNEISNSINSNLEKNSLINQDQNALDNIKINKNYQIDEDILELMRFHPEFNEYN